MDEAFSADQAARIALRCLDLTSLNEADDEAAIVRLCARAQGAQGHVAAVCVWPRFAALARRQLPPPIAVAAVANFPAGGTDIAAALRDVQQIVAAGAQEVDVVLPWRALRDGDAAAADALLRAVRQACAGAAAEGDPGNRRAARRGADRPRLAAGAGRRRRHAEDQHRQDAAGRHAAGGRA